MRRHLRGNVPRNAHYGLVAGLRLGKFRNCTVPQIVEAQPVSRAFDLADVGSALGIAALFAGLLEVRAKEPCSDTNLISDCFVECAKFFRWNPVFLML